MEALSATISALLRASLSHHSEECFHQCVTIVHSAILSTVLGKETQASINSIIHAPNSALSQKVNNCCICVDLFFSCATTIKLCSDVFFVVR